MRLANHHALDPSSPHHTTTTHNPQAGRQAGMAEDSAAMDVDVAAAAGAGDVGCTRNSVEMPLATELTAGVAGMEAQGPEEVGGCGMDGLID